MKTDHKLPKQCCAVLLSAAILVTGISCKSEDPLLSLLDTQLSNIKIDNLSRTMNLVVSPERYEKAQFEEKLAASLNRWGEAEAELFQGSDWKVDEAAAETLKTYQDLPAVAELEGMSFANTDSYYLQQNYWSKKLAQRLVATRDMSPFQVIQQSTDVDVASLDEDTDPLAVAIAKIHSGMSSDVAENLAKSLRVFDWVVRNIMLLPEDGPLNEENTAADFRLNDAQTTAAAGIPGLGYTRFPTQTMLTSRGDYVDRAKLFIMMLNQLDIDSVMLAVKSEDDSRPWAVGVHLGEQLYLFDTKLGLPIPGKSPGTFASFNDVAKNSNLLKDLDLSIEESLKDETKYWVQPEQLKSVQGMVYCPPESLSYRFWELENRLVGDAQMRLTVNASALINRLPQIEGIEYRVWDIDFRTHQFRRALRDAIAESSFKDAVRDKIRWYLIDELYIDEFVRYRTARSKYFHGLFATIRNDGNLNAIELFFNMMYKDSKIDSLATDDFFQRAYALERGNMAATDFDNLIKGVQANMRLVRRDSGYFLSQCHFDNGNFSTSANWLTRIETIEDTDRWQQAINYLRARSLEAQRDYAAAVELYEKQESEHFHGDLIRVRQLKRLVGSTEVSAATKAADDVRKANDTDNKKEAVAEQEGETNPSDDEKDPGSPETEEATSESTSSADDSDADGS